MIEINRQIQLVQESIRKTKHNIFTDVFLKNLIGDREKIIIAFEKKDELFNRYMKERINNFKKQLIKFEDDKIEGCEPKHVQIALDELTNMKKFIETNL